MCPKKNSPDEDVTKKIKSVHTQYSRELQKFKERPTGTGTDDVYKSKWPHFEELQFLQDFITSRATTSNLQVSFIIFID